MANKSFEQQVKNELSELRMKPAESVWPLVEAALQKERKRRWLIWLFLLAGCAGASFWGYYFFTKDKAEIAKIPVQIQSKEEPKEIIKEKDTLLVAIQIPVQQKIGSIVTDPVPSTKSGRNNLKPADVSTGKNVPVKAKTNMDALVDQRPLNGVFTNDQSNNQASDISNPQKETIAGNTTDNNIVKDTKKEIEHSIAIPKQTAAAKDPVPISNIDDNVTEAFPPVTQPVVTEAPPAAQTVVKAKKSKWQWNIGVDAGSSGLRKAISLPGIGTARLADAIAPSAPTNVPPAPLLAVAPAIKDAFSFGIQLQATKQLGKKNRFGLSAGYSLFQTSMNVGRKVDSSVLGNNFAGVSSSGFYYTNTDSTAYTNKYHFLRLGADLFTPFRLFRKIHFQWQLGVGVNILAATNGLHYDATTKKIFSNNALYTKMQSHFSTGIDLSIGKVPFLYIGPHWQYSFTNLTSNSGGDQHLFLSSVKVSFVLPKKKK